MEAERTFCTAVNCMDGRCQLPVSCFLKHRFKADYVDTVTEPGPNLILAAKRDVHAVNSILRRVEISVEKHHSAGIAVAGHHDCAGNPAGDDEQLEHTREAVALLKRYYPDLPVIGLWVDEHWQVSEIKL